MASRLHAAIGDVSHIERMVTNIERMVTNSAFERLSFDECVRVLGEDRALVRDEGDWRNLTRAGERRVLDRVGEFVWVTHLDHMAVPFYQAFSAEDPSKAATFGGHAGRDSHALAESGTPAPASRTPAGT